MHEPEEPHGVTVPMPHHHVNYIMIFFTLVVLTVVTVLVALHRFDNELVNVLLALLVASIKATFVAMYFMHLKFEGKLIYCIFIVPLLLTVLLVCALIPDIAHGIHHIAHIPAIVKHDAEPSSPY
jgi:cytochrome c oxidase subunit 4